MSVNGVSLGAANTGAMESKKTETKKAELKQEAAATPVENQEAEKQAATPIPETSESGNEPSGVSVETVRAAYAPYLGQEPRTPVRDSRRPDADRKDYYDSQTFGPRGVELEANTSGTYEGTEANDRIESDIITIEEPNARMVAEGRGGDDEIRLNGQFENPRITRFNPSRGVRADANGGTGSDRVEVEEFKNAFVSGGQGNDQIRVTRSDNATVNGGQGNDDIDLYNVDQAVARGGEGDDLINAGGRGNYNLAGQGGNDILNLRGGSLLATDSKATSINASGGTGNDTVNLETSNATVTVGGGQGDDVVNISTQDNPDSFMDTRFGSGFSGGPIGVGPGGQILYPEPPAFKKEFDRLGFNYRNNTVTVNGGAGQDTVNIEGRREDYTEALDAEGYRRYSNNNSADVIRVGSDVETVNFVAAPEAKTFEELLALGVGGLYNPLPVPPIFEQGVNPAA